MWSITDRSDLGSFCEHLDLHGSCNAEAKGVKCHLHALMC